MSLVSYLNNYTVSSQLATTLDSLMNAMMAGGDQEMSITKTIIKIAYGPTLIQLNVNLNLNLQELVRESGASMRRQ